jgi:Glycosyl hydrolases family 2, sugar binding domain/Glycosyl hydrolases family 2, TIM barrel domain/Glycosyl hydrolases family 2
MDGSPNLGSGSVTDKTLPPPLATRPRLSLDGEWELDVPGLGLWKTAVPGVWQTVDAKLRSYTGTATYSRRVTIPAEWKQHRILLSFGAVDYRAVVAVNGTTVGEHEGGYLPFSFEIQNMTDAGKEALIEVTVADDMAPDVPKGKQSWYGPLAGIWQSVWLEAVGDLYIDALRIEPDPASGTVSVRPSLRGDQGDPSFRLVVRCPDGTLVQSRGLEVSVVDPQLWDLNSPALYQAELRVMRGGHVIDTQSDTFGFRTVEARDGKIWLNGRPILLVGALDQDYYPHTMCTPPSNAFLREQVLLAKELGLNCLRCHIKLPDPRYLYWADRLGLLIWSELPNWETLSPAAEVRAKQTLAGMIERDGNHPSIVAWTIINESWGVDLVGDAGHRAWLGEMVDFVRTADPSRIVVDNSACIPNFHVRSDLNDFHFYSSIPDQQVRWDSFVERWTDDAGSTYSPHGDASRRGDEPMVVSEFGNWGLPDPVGLLDDGGVEPWWFDTGQDWAGGVVHPHDIERRARRWKLDEVFEELPSLFEASQEHQFESIQYEVEQMRLHPEIAGFVVTEFTDLYWECNGLMDLHRQPKAGHDDYRWIFGPDLPIAIPERRRCFVGDPIQIGVHVAHASDLDLTRAMIRWRSSDGSLKGESAISVSPWTAPRVAGFTFRPQAAGRIRLEFDLADEAGTTAGGNWTDIAVYERRTHEVPAWAEDPMVRGFLEEARLPIDRSGVLVTTGLEAPGHPGVLLASAGDAGGGVNAVERVGSSWEGDWAQGMHWFSPELRRGTPLLPRLDITCSGLVPPSVLTGLGPEPTLAGMYVGWIHRAVATAGIVRPGIVATTFPVLEAGALDPLAVALLGNLLEATTT